MCVTIHYCDSMFVITHHCDTMLDLYIPCDTIFVIIHHIDTMSVTIRISF